MNKSSKKPAKVEKRKVVRVVETQLPTFSDNLVLLRKGKKPRPEILSAQEVAKSLVGEAMSALANPGIPRTAVFRGNKASQVSSYSVWPSDPTMMVREQSNGTRTLGRVVGGRFRSLPTVK